MDNVCRGLAPEDSEATSEHGHEGRVSRRVPQIQVGDFHPFMRLITRGDFAFYVSAASSVLGILVILWRMAVARLATKEELLKELLSLREFLRREFVSRRELNTRLHDREKRDDAKT